MFETRKAIREAALRKAIQKAVENERKRIAASGDQLREQAIQKAVEKAVQQAVENERSRIVASWEQLRRLSREEFAARILAGRPGSDPGSGVSAS